MRQDTLTIEAAPAASPTSPGSLTPSPGSLTPAAGAAPTLVLGPVTASATDVSASLTCQAAGGTACRGLARLATLEKLLGSKVLALSASKKKRRSRRVTVGQTTFVLPAGQTQKISVPLNATGKKLLKQFAALPATMTITLLNTEPPSSVQTKITIKAKPKRRTPRR
jgi:hypothetical protein